MSDRDNGIEPIFEEEEDPGLRESADPPPFNLGPEKMDMRVAIRVVAIVVVSTCVFLVGDRLYTRYQERQAVKALERGLEALSGHMTQSLGQAGAALDQANRKARARAAAAEKQRQARIEQQRRTRMTTTAGGWLGKNCADWTRSWKQTGAETAQREMKKHCDRYERYLETGIAPRDTPRAGAR